VHECTSGLDSDEQLIYMDLELDAIKFDTEDILISVDIDSIIWMTKMLRLHGTIEIYMTPPCHSKPVSYPIHSRFSSEVPDTRSDQIRSTDPYRICYDKLLHSYPVHITLNTAYFLHLVYLPFRYIGYAYFRLCLLIRSPVINFWPMFDF
jgi:hypothetical protein